MRTPLIAGNWKLNKSLSEAQSFVSQFTPLVSDVSNVDIVICPTFLALSAISQSLRHSATGKARIGVAGQDIYWKEDGAYTGEVSGSLLRDAGANYVVIGHSERRGRFGVPEPDLEGAAGSVFGDSDQSVNLKLHAALRNGLTPLVCVGEMLTERQNGDTDAVVAHQTVMALQGIQAASIASVVFAYEPVWAIGTGETCAGQEANRVCGVIRATIEKALGSLAAEKVRIQYGGSVKPENALELLSMPHIDGALVGGASLKADSFAAIVQAASQASRKE